MGFNIIYLFRRRQETNEVRSDEVRRAEASSNEIMTSRLKRTCSICFGCPISRVLCEKWGLSELPRSTQPRLLRMYQRHIHKVFAEEPYLQFIGPQHIAD